MVSCRPMGRLTQTILRHRAAVLSRTLGSARALHSFASEYRRPEALVSTSWLEDNLRDPALRVYDCTTHLIYTTVGSAGHARVPYEVVSGRDDYGRGHIPGAGFLDLQGALSVDESPHYFTLPSAEEIADALAAHGMGDESRVVLYSSTSPQWATRLWWMLRSIGFDHAAVLNGGLTKWKSEARPISTEACSYPPAKLTARPRPQLWVDKSTTLAAIDDGRTCIINALTNEIHRGDDLQYGRAGHITGSVNVPVRATFDANTTEFYDAMTVRRLFEAAGAHEAEKVIVYCGGGIAATGDAFLLHQLGCEDVAVYDASLSEWTKDSSLPMKT